jgi:hypothetical protein
VTVQTKSELLAKACREVEQHRVVLSKRTSDQRRRDFTASDRLKKPNGNKH